MLPSEIPSMLNLRLDVFNRVVRLDIKVDRLSREGVDEDLHVCTTANPRTR